MNLSSQQLGIQVRLPQLAQYSQEPLLRHGIVILMGTICFDGCMKVSSLSFHTNHGCTY